MPDPEPPHIAKLRERNRAHRNGDLLYEDADWLREAYWDRRLTLRQMAAEARCSLRTIVRWMEIREVPTERNRAGNRNRGADCYQWKGGPKPCPRCGGPKTFYATNCQGCLDITGSRNPKWRPDEAVTYDAMHQRVKAARGRPETHPCGHCGGQAQEWAYDHADPDERLGGDGPFSLNPAHYLPLCVPCHRKFDNGRAAGRRHSALA